MSTALQNRAFSSSELVYRSGRFLHRKRCFSGKGTPFFGNFPKPREFRANLEVTVAVEFHLRPEKKDTLKGGAKKPELAKQGAPALGFGV